MTVTLDVPFEAVFRLLLLLPALLLFGLVRELALLLLDDLAAEDRLLPEALRLFVPEPLLLLGLDPFELLAAGFRLLVERELAWAIFPP